MTDTNRREWPTDPHYLEKVMEHVFLGRLLEECWFRRGRVVEVMRAEVDAAGFDLILEVDGVVRHVQLKATKKGGSTKFVDVNRRLAARQGGCIVWMEYEASSHSGLGVVYRWREASELPAKEGKSPRHSRLGRSDFTDKSDEMRDLVEWLFPRHPRT